MDTQINKGIIEMCLLQLISSGEYYGYTLMQEMSQYFTETDPSVFYSILRRLNKAGLIESYTGTNTAGPPRKYHRITDKGTIYLNAKKQKWHMLMEVSDKIGL